ncbi:MAG: phospho-sugar mutase [Bacteriovoracaceae bacterium]|nr:phospho-sugar mutase [Bacteriovoracaceae bacterium]
MEQQAIEKAKEWANNEYFDAEDRAEISKLLENGDHKEIVERFYKDLEFGTGGLRAILGMGTNRMSKYQIRRATQAVVNRVLEVGESKKIAISYDSRKFSYEFAKEVASVCAGNGVEAYIYKRLNPVSLLSFSTRHHKAQAGIMVTASHNPPEYNGYKVFWSDGSQVTPPNDKAIINFYQSVEYSSIKIMDFEEGVTKGMIHWVGEDVENKYYDAIKSKIINPELCKERGKELKIVYTPIHGTGLYPCTRALDDMSLTNYLVVKEQAEPDHRFPTVSSPNPENPEALAMAVELMEKENADIVMGSDPDTDRLGVALKHEGRVQYINGNQIGVLMLHYILSNLKEQGKLPDNSYFVKTIVTTDLQKTIADDFGVETENTLTGFKWICGKVNQIEKDQPERNFLFGTEESFGYLNHDYVRDKDGVSSVTLMAEIALWYKTQGLNLFEALDKIYEKYGFSHETLLNLNYYGKDGADKIVRIMDNFRKMNPTEICGLKVTNFSDWKESYTKNLETGDKTKIDMPTSNVLGFEFENGSKFFLRPSGTEPKIKFYLLMKEEEGSLDEKKERAQKVTDSILDFIKKEADQA